MINRSLSFHLQDSLHCYLNLYLSHVTHQRNLHWVQCLLEVLVKMVKEAQIPARWVGWWHKVNTYVNNIHFWMQTFKPHWPCQLVSYASWLPREFHWFNMLYVILSSGGWLVNCLVHFASCNSIPHTLCMLMQLACMRQHPVSCASSSDNAALGNSLLSPSELCRCVGYHYVISTYL